MSTRYAPSARPLLGLAALLAACSGGSTSPEPVALAAPQELAALLLPSGAVRLSWVDASIGEQGFQVERAADVGGAPAAFVQIASLPADSEQHDVLDVQAGTIRWYRVRAFAAQSASPYSNAVAVTTPPEGDPGTATATVTTLALPFDQGRPRLLLAPGGGSFLRCDSGANTVVVAFDAQGGVVWSRELTAHLELARAADGDLWVFGGGISVSQPGLVAGKLDAADGALLWLQHYDDTLSSSWIEPTNAPNGAALEGLDFTGLRHGRVGPSGALDWQGTLLVEEPASLELSGGGRLEYGGAFSIESGVVRLTAAGEVAFSRALLPVDPLDPDRLSVDLAYECADGGVGLVGHFAPQELWVAKLDAGGGIEEQVTLAGLAGQLAPPRVAGTPGEGWFIALQDQASIWVLRVSADGALEWVRQLDSPAYDRVALVLARPGGGCAVLGQRGPSPAESTAAFVAALDAAGGLEWERALEAGDAEQLVDACGTPEGGFVVVGSSQPAPSQLATWCVRLGPNGEALERALWSATGTDHVPGPLWRLADGRTVLAGEVWGTGSSGAVNDLLLVEFAPDGGLVRSVAVDDAIALQGLWPSPSGFSLGVDGSGALRVASAMLLDQAEIGLLQIDPAPGSGACIPAAPSVDGVVVSGGVAVTAPAGEDVTGAVSAVSVPAQLVLPGGVVPVPAAVNGFPAAPQVLPRCGP